MSAIPVSNDVKQNGDPLITIRGLRTVLNGKTIFDDVDLDIPRGGITAIMNRPTAVLTFVPPKGDEPLAMPIASK